GVCDAGGGRDIGEGAVAVVPVEDVGPQRGHKDVDEAVIVVVAERTPHSVRGTADAGLLGYVRELSGAVVVEELVLPRRVDEVDVEPAIVVVVEEPAPGSHGLDDVFLGG